MSCTGHIGPERPTTREAAERRRLAEDLHDGALQDLAAINLKLAALEMDPSTEPGEVRDRVHELRALTESVIAEINRTIRLLSGFEQMPKSEAETEPAGAALLPRLRDLVDTFRSDSGLACRFSVSAEHLRFEPAVAEVVHRAISELLTNVEKHAQASRVEIETAVRPDGAVVIRVADDGVGLPELTWPNLPLDGGGFGLWSIEHRLSELGAFIEIENDNGLNARIILPARLTAGD